MAVLENDHLRVTVALDRGAEIVEFRSLADRGGPAPPTPGRHPRPARLAPSVGATGGTFLDHYAGGWQEILPNGGPAVTWRGVEYGQHGEVSLVPWTLEVLEDEPDRVSVVCRVRALRTPLLLERRMTLRGDRAGAVPRRAADERVRRGPRRDVGPPRRVRAAVPRRRDEDPHVGAARRRRGGDGGLRAAAGGRRATKGRGRPCRAPPVPSMAARPARGPSTCRSSRRGLRGRPGDGVPVVVRRTGLVRDHVGGRRLRDALGRRPVPLPVAVAGVRGGRGLPVVEARPHGGPGAVDQLPDPRPARGGTARDAARRAGGLDDRDVTDRDGVRAGLGGHHGHRCRRWRDLCGSGRTSGTGR